MSFFFNLENLSVLKEIKKIIIKKSHKIMLQKNKIVQYDEFGDTFGKSRLSLRWEEIDDVLSHFLKHVPTTGHIADIGC
jgi:hypothetical protein